MTIFVFLVAIYLFQKEANSVFLRRSRNLGDNTNANTIDEQYFRMVVSLTTSPLRILQIENSLNSIFSQTKLPDRIYLNLPHVFKRNNDTYSKLDKLHIQHPTINSLIKSKTHFSLMF
jgi:hypothetical protein